MLIAVPLTDKNFEDGLKACKELGADIVELRVDMFQDADVNHLRELIKKVHDTGLRNILTIRSEKEGGRHVPNRLKLFEELSPTSDYTDLELSSESIISKVRDIVKAHDKKLILSYHNFERTPPRWILKEIFRKAKRWGADIVKVAVKANSYEDVATLLCTGKEEEGEKILISMGSVGSISRLAGFIFGSAISYAFIGQAVAEGQIPLEEMVKLRRLFYG